MAKMDGLLPGEYCEYGTVLVWPKGVDGEITPEGIEVRPEFFVLIVRARPDGNNQLKFTEEVLTTAPLDTGVIPHDVLMRGRAYYDAIVSRRRSDNARERAAAKSDPESMDDRRNGIHLVEDHQ